MNLWGSCCLICSFQCSLYCLFFFLLTYIVPPSSIFRFRLPIWYTTLFHLPFLVTHLLYHPLPFTVSGYPFGIPPSSIYRFWLPIWYTTLFHLPFLDPFGIFKPFFLWSNHGNKKNPNILCFIKYTHLK
jgi:hypothetical protein